VHAAVLRAGCQVRQRSLFHHEAWANLAAHTEAAWRHRALAGDWPTWKRHDGEVLELVCRANLDLHLGTAGRCSKRFGNLGTDGAHKESISARTRRAICGLTGRAALNRPSSADRPDKERSRS
jgi:hypothetical protein